MTSSIPVVRRGTPTVVETSMRRFRSPGVAASAIAGSMVLTAGSMMPPGLLASVKTVPATVALLADEALIMGGSGMPIPPQSWVDDVFDKYVALNVVDGYTPHALFTPEAFYPLTGVKSLPFDTSVSQDVTILDTTIRDHLADGDNLVVFGYSQSATITSLEMQQLAADPPSLDPGQQLSVVLIGDPSNPNGGILERFDGLSFPSLGLTFSGATQPDTIYPTDIYTTEYDGWADFPRYPLDILSVLNAFAGSNPHFAYPDLRPGQIAGAVELPGSADLTGVGATNYWMIPTENLPLLDPLRAVPVVGNPLAELLQPDLRVLVNLGYGSIENGWDPGPANVPTEFGLFPTNIDPMDVLQALAAGAQQGVNDFMVDLSSPATSSSSLPLQWLFDLMTNPELSAAALPSPTDIVNALSAAAAAGYAALLPTADIANALLTTVPAYDASLFLRGMEDLAGGDPMGLVSAFGDPIAANTALFALLSSFESAVVSDAIQSVIGESTSLTLF